MCIPQAAVKSLAAKPWTGSDYCSCKRPRYTVCSTGCSDVMRNSEGSFRKISFLPLTRYTRVIDSSGTPNPNQNMKRSHRHKSWASLDAASIDSAFENQCTESIAVVLDNRLDDWMPQRTVETTDLPLPSKFPNARRKVSGTSLGTSYSLSESQLKTILHRDNEFADLFDQSMPMNDLDIFCISEFNTSRPESTGSQGMMYRSCCKAMNFADGLENEPAAKKSEESKKILHPDKEFADLFDQSMTMNDLDIFCISEFNTSNPEPTGSQGVVYRSCRKAMNFAAGLENEAERRRQRGWIANDNANCGRS
jgi:hypothetical protein